MTGSLEMAQRLADQVRVETSSCSACGAPVGRPCRAIGASGGHILDRPHSTRGRPSGVVEVGEC